MEEEILKIKKSEFVVIESLKSMEESQDVSLALIQELEEKDRAHQKRIGILEVSHHFAHYDTLFLTPTLTLTP